MRVQKKRPRSLMIGHILPINCSIFGAENSKIEMCKSLGISIVSHGELRPLIKSRF